MKYLNFQFHITMVGTLPTGQCSGWWSEIFPANQVPFEDTWKPVQINISDFLLLWTWNVEICAQMSPWPMPYQLVRIQGHGPKYYWPSRSQLGILASSHKLRVLIFYCHRQEGSKIWIWHLGLNFLSHKVLLNQPPTWFRHISIYGNYDIIWSTMVFLPIMTDKCHKPNFMVLVQVPHMQDDTN